jgi:hypothetical protein
MIVNEMNDEDGWDDELLIQIYNESISSHTFKVDFFPNFFF